MFQMKLKIMYLILLFLSLSVNMLTAQKKSKKITICGYVNDSGNNPLVGAVILIDNKNTPIHTDNNGYYKIRIRPDAIMISALLQNYRIKPDSIRNQTTINFVLEKNEEKQPIGQTEGKSEESVDMGYRIIDPKKTAISVNKLNVSGNEYSTYHNIYEMIRGKVAGVEVNGQKIRIRGLNSMTGNNDPMFVVDGMPINSIDNILPSTVQSITLLKGTAAAIYGSRGVNGVIVITLKKGTFK